MDPIEIIVFALASGAAIAFKTTVEQGVKDAYTGLKELIQRKYGSPPSLEALEKKPKSKPKQSSLAEDLREAGAAADTETLESAIDLLDTLMPHAPEVVAAIGVDLRDIEAAYVHLRGIKATAENGSATGFRFDGGKVTEGIEVHDVSAEARGAPPPKKP